MFLFECLYTPCHGLQGTSWYEKAFEYLRIEPLRPLDRLVNYALTIQQPDPWTVELTFDKFWREARDYLVCHSMVLKVYESHEYSKALEDRDILIRVYEVGGVAQLRLTAAWI